VTKQDDCGASQITDQSAPEINAEHNPLTASLATDLIKKEA